jgi:NADH:ubiquinone oxidoreductase subunit H
MILQQPICNVLCLVCNLLFFSLVQSIIFLLCILLSIAYFTLFERKILSYSQSRVGPNKSGGLGLLQPVLDGVKLIGKESFTTAQSGMLLFFVAPLSLFPFIIESWILPTDLYTLNERTFLALFFLSLLALSVLGLLLSGIISASKFGYLGGMRASSQRVSYEISLSLVLFSLQALSERLQ